MKTFKYRIYPNKLQRETLNKHLQLSCLLYNMSLEQRELAYKSNTKLSRYDQSKQLTELRKDTEFGEVYSQVLQTVLQRLDLAYQSFFRRVKRGQTPGFPRFKKNIRSLVYPQYLFEIKEKLYIPSIGYIKIKYHRNIEGKIKTLTVKKTLTDKWYVTIVCESLVKDKVTEIVKSIGIDLGLKKFLVTSDNTVIENPRFLRKSLERLKHLSCKLSNKVKGSSNRRKMKQLLARLHEKIHNQRTNFLHKLSTELVNNNDLICHEDLNVQNMLQSKLTGRFKRNLNRSTSDVSWTSFITMLTYKAENAGKYIIAVNPKDTSRTCSVCQEKNFHLELKNRTFVCPSCHVELNRDYNASLNILREGQQQIRQELPEFKLPETIVVNDIYDGRNSVVYE